VAGFVITKQTARYEVYLKINLDGLQASRKCVSMNMWLKKIGISLLLISGIANVCAQSGGNRRDEREAAYAFYAQGAPQDRGGQGGEQQPQRQNERRRGREFDSSGFGAQGDNPSNNSSDASRRQGKLSPEERRALRRQIDEAGHDIYTPRR
jgi:hypothetical protein